MVRSRALSVLVAILLLGGCRSSAPAPAANAAAGRGTVKMSAFEVPYVVEGSGRPCIVYGLMEYGRRAVSDRLKGALRCAFVQARLAIPAAPTDPARPFTVDVAVEDLEAARAALGMTRFVLVGHSINGTVALAYALRYPEHVSHVIAVAATPELGASFAAAGEAYWTKEASPERKAVHERNRAALTEEALAKMAPADAVAADIAADAAKRWHDPRFDERPLLSLDRWNVPVVMELFGSEYRLFRGDEQVRVPVFLAMGRSDFAVPYTVWEPWRARFLDLTFAVFDRSGHVPQVEESQAFDSRVIAWLASR